MIEKQIPLTGPIQYKKIHLNRLYNGLASVRDYVWKEAVDKGMGIEFECNGVTMKVEPWEVKEEKPGKKVFRSKFSKQEYSLVDFRWKAK